AVGGGAAGAPAPGPAPPGLRAGQLAVLAGVPGPHAGRVLPLPRGRLRRAAGRDDRTRYVPGARGWGDPENDSPAPYADGCVGPAAGGGRGGPLPGADGGPGRRTLPGTPGGAGRAARAGRRLPPLRLLRRRGPRLARGGRVPAGGARAGQPAGPEAGGRARGAGAAAAAGGRPAARGAAGAAPPREPRGEMAGPGRAGPAAGAAGPARGA